MTEKAALLRKSIINNTTDTWRLYAQTPKTPQRADLPLSNPREPGTACNTDCTVAVWARVDKGIGRSATMTLGVELIGIIRAKIRRTAPA